MFKIIKKDTITSTNTWSKDNIETIDDKTIVSANHQTQGRGRFVRKWVSDNPENIYMSFVLKPKCEDFSKLPLANLTQYLALCLVKVLEEYDTEPKIKWPNDIMIDGMRKISGILSETVIEGGVLKGIVLGVGINLNAERTGVESIHDRIATALNLEIGRHVDAQIFLNEFLNEFFAHYEQFLAQGFEYIKHDYINKNCFLDKDLNVQVLNEIKSGTATGITDDGALILNKNEVLTIGDIL